jgi:hypothetical protein
MGQSWEQLRDFLASLYNSPEEAARLQATPWPGPSGQGMPGEPNTPGNILPGGGVMSYPATTPGAPSMGYPALAGPLAAPAQTYDPLTSIHAPAAAPAKTYDPLTSIRTPAAPTAPALPPPRPAAAPLPTPKAKGAKVKMNPDLGMNPRFSTFQSQVPAGARGGPLSSNPIYTALNLFGG